MSARRAPLRTSGALGIALLAAALAHAPAARAQNRNPSVSYIYPAGGRRGTTFRMVVGGRQLPDRAEPVFSGTGLTARVVAARNPPRQDQQDALSAELRELGRRKEVSLRRKDRGRGEADDWSETDEARLQDLIELMAMLARSREAPAFAERLELEVTIAPDAPPGRRDFRLVSPGGISAPQIFEVGELPEIAEPPLTAAAVMSTVGGQRAGPWRRFLSLPKSEREAPLPAVVNGQIGPGERDPWRLDLRAGQRLVVVVAARELRPYIADAVPGWCDTVISLYDPEDRPVAAADSWRFHPDPVLYYEARRDGPHTLEIRDCIYRGREDFVYRMTVGELPFVTDWRPLGARAGATTRLELAGWNLDKTVIPLTADLARGIHALPPALLGAYAAAPLRFAVDDLPEIAEPNSRGRRPPTVTLPAIVNGRVESPGESDVYAFSGIAGQRIVAEIYARRLGSPLDSRLELLDAADAVLAANDDHPDRGAGLVTHHADARLEATLPKDGEYRVRVSDAQDRGGETFAYRLRVSEPRPDFELRIVPSGVALRRGATATVTAHALRRDGFAGDIDLALVEAQGFELSGARIPAGKDEAKITIRAGRDAPPGPTELRFRGEAEIGGLRVARSAVPAEDQEQAFLWRFLVPAETFVAHVPRGPPATPPGARPAAAGAAPARP